MEDVHIAAKATAWSKDVALILSPQSRKATTLVKHPHCIKVVGVLTVKTRDENEYPFRFAE